MIVLCSEDAVSSRVATLRDEIYDEKRGERATALSGERIDVVRHQKRSGVSYHRDWQSPPATSEILQPLRF